VKSLATKLSINKAVGLCVGEHEIAMSHVAATLKGPVEISRQCQPYAAEDITAVLEQMLASLVAGKRGRRLLVAIAIPAARVFYSTRAMRGSDNAASPESLLQKVLQSPSICIDDMIVDLMKIDFNKTPMASISACRKRYLGGLVGALKRCGMQPYRIEPSPCALVRTAVQQHPAPRKTKTLIRLFLGANQGLATIVFGNLPFTWRHFEISRSNEEMAVLSAVRTLRTLDRFFGLQLTIDTVMIHGGSEFHDRFRDEAFVKEVGARIICCDGPKFDAAEVAFGSALGCLKQEPRSFDLSRSLKPRPSLMDIFPWGELALQAAMVGCVALSLFAQSMSLSDARAGAQAENARHKCLASSTRAELAKERKDLSAKVDAVREFLANRILWTEYTQDIPARMPTNATLTAFRGIVDTSKSSKGGLKKQLMLGGSAPIAEDGRTPHEIDEFLTALRNDPLLKRDFPLVNLADIRRIQLLSEMQPSANFTVLCTPAAKPAAAASGDPKGKKKK
jgi:hypothetical protein